MAFPEISHRIMAISRVFRIAGARVAVASVAAVSFSAGNSADGSWALFSDHEIFDVHLGMYKPIIWAHREADTNPDKNDPTQSGGVYRFDLKEIVSESTYPTGVNLSVNFFGIVEPRFSYEWFTFKYHSYDLPFNGSKVDRKDYTFDLLLGYDMNKMSPAQALGCLYRLYVYAYGGIGYTDYNEFIASGIDTLEGNIILADTRHFNLGIGARFGLNKLINVGAELGTKVRDFKTVQSPQPSGAASEGYLRLDFSVAFGR